MTVRLLFLDRDGTLNRSFGYRPPNSVDEVELLPNVRETLSRYVAEEWQLVIVSNQGGVARGYISEPEARAIQQRVIDLLGLPVAASYLCPHLAGAAVAAYDLDCPNRKPNPGFIFNALDRFQTKARDCLFVGDLASDQQAAQAAGVPFGWADPFFNRTATA
ncbi:MAG: HAD-IIIA family hydrolase [Anaerolineae bacterium]|nr:HAD-IIIA family hydrolase [Anaerolineae bacterium]